MKSILNRYTHLLEQKITSRLAKIGKKMAISNGSKCQKYNKKHLNFSIQKVPTYWPCLIWMVLWTYSMEVSFTFKTVNKLNIISPNLIINKTASNSVIHLSPGLVRNIKSRRRKQ